MIGRVYEIETYRHCRIGIRLIRLVCQEGSRCAERLTIDGERIALGLDVNICKPEPSLGRSVDWNREWIRALGTLAHSECRPRANDAAGGARWWGWAVCLCSSLSCGGRARAGCRRSGRFSGGLCLC